MSTQQFFHLLQVVNHVLRQELPKEYRKFYNSLANTINQHLDDNTPEESIFIEVHTHLKMLKELFNFYTGPRIPWHPQIKEIINDLSEES